MAISVSRISLVFNLELARVINLELNKVQTFLSNS